jgi:hypothetical protein
MKPRALALACAFLCAVQTAPALSQQPTQCLSPDLIIETFTSNGGTVRPLEGDPKVKASLIYALSPPREQPRDWTWILYVTFTPEAPSYLLYGEDGCMATRLLVPPEGRKDVERVMFGEGA